MNKLTCPATEEIINTLSKADNEGTAAPYWLILDPRQMLRLDVDVLAGMITGPFFSREDAQLYLKNKRYNFSKNAKVYCHAGHQSWKYAEIFDGNGNPKIEDSPCTCPASKAVEEIGNYLDTMEKEVWICDRRDWEEDIKYLKSFILKHMQPPESEEQRNGVIRYYKRSWRYA